MLRMFGKGLSPNPPQLEALALKERGNRLLAEGNLHGAAACYRQAVALNSDFVAGYVNLGFVLRELGQHDEAESALRSALSVEPDQADAWYILGTIAHRRGELELAISHFERARDANPQLAAAYPSLAQAHYDLGVVRQQKGAIDAAIESFRTAIGFGPDEAIVHCHLGAAYFVNRDIDHAIEHFRRATELDPHYVDAHHNLGSALQAIGDADASIASYLETLRLAPQHADTYVNLGTAYGTLGRVDEAKQSFRRAMSIHPDSVTAQHAQSNLLVLLSHGDHRSAAEYLEEAMRYGERALARATPYTSWQCKPSSQSLKVGLVSGDLRQHPVGFFLESVLTHLDRQRISLAAYSNTLDEDALTARIRPMFNDWTVIANLSDELAARKIHDDGVDILVDLTGHLQNNRLPLFAWKPAPVQATWLGYWASTGVPGIDYLLADPLSVPTGGEAAFSEAIWFLPDTRLCFTAPSGGSDLALSPLPAVQNGHVTFGCYQNLFKITDASIALWGAILRALPEACLRIQDKHLSYRAACERLEGRLEKVGVASERVSMHGHVARDEYLKTYANVDIVLDTFPFTGGTTTCEALWMGVPTLTLAGQTLISRQGASMLSCVGLDDWVAYDEEAYVRQALAHARDIPALAKLRASMRERLVGSPLFDAKGFARNLGNALFGMRG